MSKKMFFIFFWVLFLKAVFVPASFAGEPETKETAGTLKAFDTADPSAAGIDFENYQRNIDDIFHVALMTNPDLGYSVNSIIVDLNRRLAENPTDPRTLMSLGHVYRILGQPSEANRFYTKALELDPKNFHLNLFSAMMDTEQESFEEALKHLDEALQIHPLDVYTWMTKGKILMALRRDKEAADSFQKALEIQPENRQAAFALSLLEQRLGHNEKAREILEKLRESQPRDLFVRYHLGALALMDRKAGKALEYWEGIFQEGIRDPFFLFNLSLAYQEAKQPEKAEKILEHLRFFMPRELDVELLMADVYGQMGRLTDAERAFRGILAEQPDNLTAAMGLGQVLEKQGRKSERDEVLQSASESARKVRNLQAEKSNLENAFPETSETSSR